MKVIFFAQQVFTSLVPKPSIKTYFVHWHCSLPFRIFANLQETRLLPNLSFALLSSHLLQVQGKTTTSCVCLSAQLQQASGAFKRERGRAVKDLVKHVTIVSLFTFATARPSPIDCERAPRLGESNLPLSDQQRNSQSYVSPSKLPFNRSFCRHHTRQAEVKSTETPRIDILKKTRSCVNVCIHRTACLQRAFVDRS